MTDHLRWTDKPPEAPGVYWVYQDGGTRIVKVYKKGINLYTDCGGGVPPSNFDRACWYGPLVEPPFESPKIALSQAQQDIFVRWVVENVTTEVIRTTYLIAKIRGEDV